VTDYTKIAVRKGEKSPDGAAVLTTTGSAPDGARGALSAKKKTATKMVAVLKALLGYVLR